MQFLKTVCVGLAALSAAAAEHIKFQIRNGQLPAHAVNLGGWLVAEHWMTWSSPIWEGVPDDIANSGEYATMKYLGHGVGDARFEQHRQQWITEGDIREIASRGLNTVRVPVGYWIMGEDPTDWPHHEQYKVYAPGALKYLDTLINDWANKYNVAVMLSLHAHKGSQNGRDHSAPTEIGVKYWSKYWENIESSVVWAKFMAARYKDSPAFLGLNLMNEPEYDTDPNVVRSYFERTYKEIRATGNDCVIGVSPMLSEQGPPNMMDFMRWPAYYNVWHEWHPYFVWGYEGKNEEQLIEAVKEYGRTHIQPWSGNWLFLGEWSMASPGSASFNDEAQFRRFGQTLLDVFRGAHQGWAFLSWRVSGDGYGRNGWSMRQMLRNGWLKL
ncbi:TPA: hypothetical protein N0F65_006105 [Lagenidium giganteum]|uniref:glucan 1,3-beta-glucosidase n=1 Tax=Lagenidium giganteum TaxID=4803 RepID=A0AAV2Z8E5_9STRA|nr:TPA: hypothetical protein N0F65_006105 [Lagenidium giganteum]